MVKPRKRHHSAVTRPAHQRPRSQRKAKKPAKVFSNALIAQNWDRKQTLAQNYQRLGLTSRLGRRSGGVEPSVRARKGRLRDEEQDEDEVTVPGVGEVQVEKDAAGNIVRIIQADQDTESNDEDNGTVEEDGIRRAKTAAELRFTPLQSSIVLSDTDTSTNPSITNPHAPSGFLGAQVLSSATENDGDIVSKLARQAIYAQNMHAHRAKRKQSQRERDWCEQMVKRHGNDYAAMTRDGRLNVMQQSEGDVRRRVRRYLGQE